MYVYITFTHFWLQNHLDPFLNTLCEFYLEVPNLDMHKVCISSIFSVILMLK